MSVEAKTRKSVNEMFQEEIGEKAVIGGTLIGVLKKDRITGFTGWGAASCKSCDPVLNISALFGMQSG